MRLGSPRLHLRRTDSTNERARALAAAGAPHGTLVTTDEQTAGRGRQGRNWVAAPGRALLGSLVLREWPELLPLAAGLAVAETVGEKAKVKWPNDVLVDGRKVAGILVEGRPQAGWMVLGVGMNVAVRIGDLPAELRHRAGTLGLDPTATEPVLERLLETMQRRLSAGHNATLAAFRARDALAGREVRWAEGRGRARGIDDAGRLVVQTADQQAVTLAAGEVHLEGGPPRGG